MSDKKLKALYHGIKSHGVNAKKETFEKIRREIQKRCNDANGWKGEHDGE